MTILPDLSDEILDKILSFREVSEQLISIYKCGNHLLNTRLCRSITSFRVLNTPLRRMIRFPSLLFSLPKLREVDVYVHHWEDPLSIVHDAIVKLPSTLKVLSIVSPSCELLCLHSEALKAQSSTSTSNEASSKKDENLFIDVKSYFPELEALKIASVKSDGLFSLRPQDWAIFPATLKHLHWTAAKLDGAVDVSGMPQLESLVLDFYGFTNFPQLPSSMRMINGRFRSSSVSFLTYLPRHLTSLGCYRLKNYYLGPAAALPHSLTSLSLGPTRIQEELFRLHGIDWLSALPANLTFLQVPPENTISLDRIKLLPRKLVELRDVDLKVKIQPLFALIFSQLQEEDIPSIADIMWPPNLRIIDTAPQTILELLLPIRVLPPTLTDLKGHVKLDRFGNVAPFPPHLTQLCLTDKSLLPYMDEPPQFESLTCLTTLSLETHTMPQLLFTQLPSSLKHLHVKFHEWDTALMRNLKLPVGLETLEMTAIEPSLFGKLPRDLKHAKFCLLYNKITSQDFDALPPSLVSLETKFSKDLEFLPEIFSHLPESLAFLKLNQFISAELLVHLNPNIRWFYTALETPTSSREEYASSYPQIPDRWLDWLDKAIGAKDEEIDPSKDHVLTQTESKYWSSMQPYWMPPEKTFCRA